MSYLPYHIHEFITERRRLTPLTPAEVPAETPSEGTKFFSKEYPRMEKVELPKLPISDVSLTDALLKRSSSHTLSSSPLSLNELGSILGTLSLNGQGSKNYPSGGALYPIECYVLIQNVDGLPRGVYHYAPAKHCLERLWDLPSPMKVFPRVNQWANGSRAVIVFTGTWVRSRYKYENFGYFLGLIEAGHAAQNVLLATAALNVPSCPLAGINDERVAELLDLDTNVEQPVYAIALG